MSGREEVLVLPRGLFDGHHAFLDWQFIEDIMEELEATHRWWERTDAEESSDWVQPIACAVVTDSAGRHYVFRRVKNTRDDLKGRVTLVVGGHIEPHAGSASFCELLLATLRREIEEEVGIEDFADAKPLGVVIDNSTVLSSRHVGFVFEVVWNLPLVARATDEFSRRSQLNGLLATKEELTTFHSQLDPWSRLIFEDRIRPGIRKLPRQRAFSLDI